MVIAQVLYLHELQNHSYIIVISKSMDINLKARQYLHGTMLGNLFF